MADRDTHMHMAAVERNESERRSAGRPCTREGATHGRECTEQAALHVVCCRCASPCCQSVRNAACLCPPACPQDGVLVSIADRPLHDIAEILAAKWKVRVCRGMHARAQLLLWLLSALLAHRALRACRCCPSTGRRR